MFNSGNSTPFTMPVTPAYGNGGGMGGWNSDWVALAILALIFGDGWGMGGMGGMGMFLPFMFMNGGFGFGGNSNGCGCNDNNNAIQAAVQRGFDNQTVVSKLDGINSGICSLGYDQLAQMNNLGMTVANGFHGVDNAVCTLGYQTQQGFNQATIANMQGNFALQNAINDNTVAGMQNTNALQAQLSQCCCDNRVGQMQIQNQMAADTCAITNQANTNTRDIIDSQNAGFRAILDKMCQQELAAKDATIAAQNQRIFGLELAASQATQNSVLMASMDANKAEILRKTGAECPTAAYIVQPPQPVTFPTNCCGGVNYAGYGNNGCGCGNNNGCGCC